MKQIRHCLGPREAANAQFVCNILSWTILLGNLFIYTFHEIWVSTLKCVCWWFHLNSQQMIAAAEREKKLRQKAASYQENEANSLQHSPAAVRARIITRRRRRSSAPRDVPYCVDSSPSIPAPPPHINSRYKTGLMLTCFCTFLASSSHHF